MKRLHASLTILIALGAGYLGYVTLDLNARLDEHVEDIRAAESQVRQLAAKVDQAAGVVIATHRRVQELERDVRDIEGLRSSADRNLGEIDGTLYAIESSVNDLEVCTRSLASVLRGFSPVVVGC